MKLRTLLLAIAISGLTIASASTPIVKQQQIKQQKRIINGVANGELTKREVQQLEAQQIHINRTKQKAKSDGVVTKKEKAVIHAKQQNASRNIYRKKHNARNRY